MIFSPWRSSVPWKSVSAVNIRHMFFTGEVQRSISSIAVGQQLRVRAARPTVAVTHQLLGATGQGVPGGLVAADQDQQGFHHDLVVGHPLSLDFGIYQYGEQVVGGLGSTLGDIPMVNSV